MMSFSERMKIAPEKQIQMKDIDDSLRHRIINKVEALFDDEQARYILDALGYRIVLNKVGFDMQFLGNKENLNRLITRLEALPWNKIYDIIELGYDFLRDFCSDCTDDCDEVYDEDSNKYGICKIRDNMNTYSTQFNIILKQEKSGYRLINGLVTPIIGENEIECIESATDTKFHSVNTHFQKALLLYSDRENPDYENSIKESISAVEAMCCTITGMTGSQATLGNALKHLENSGIILHSALKSAFEKMYGYASDTDGIRHGGIDFKNAPAEDAKYMLISCSAFVNYLIEKYSKIGGKN